MKTGQLKFTERWRDRLSDYVTAIAWSKDGHHLAAASAAGDVVLFDFSDRVVPSRAVPNRVVLQSAQGKAVNALGFSADGQYLAAGGQSGDVMA
ncbi:MAG: hypothetical protein ACFB4J_04835, partial [Elainellaceae cyanobacterium]